MDDRSTVHPKVGEVGKSRACHDCKRRKIKCDYRKPTCLRCEKAEIACKGYKRDAIFVNRTPKNLSAVLKRDSLSPHVPRSVDEDLQVLKSQIQKPVGQRTHFRLQALECLKKLYLPQPSLANIRESSLYSWLPTVCELEGESHALDHSLLTFCVVQAAVTKTGSACIDEALQVYNVALQKLLVEIEDFGAERCDEILAAISVLSTSELFLCPTDHAWRAHAQGISEILRIKNDMNSPSSTCRRFCARLRVILLIEALAKRETRSMTIHYCYLLSQVMSKSSEHDSFHGLIDVACQVPVLLEESDTLISSRNTMPDQERESLFKASLAVLDKLHDRHQKYRAITRRPLYWVMPSGVDNPADDAYQSKLFPFALQFDSLETASQVVLWWAITLQVLCSMIDLYQHFFGSSILSSVSDLSEPENFTGPEPLLNSTFPTMSSVKEEADKMARCLCQSIEYCHKIENGTIGPQMTTYAQWVLKSYFRRFHYERELAWCLNIKNMRGPGFRHGIELMGFQD
ncbi:hypothetical protein N431DRAFT_545916 [Stipitochalara longipes BDJ]|nr:hypothetical protein N431DRAFT_545916 [Stipitochalara longipes BDJ]